MTLSLRKSPHPSITSILHSLIPFFITPEAMWEQSATLWQLSLLIMYDSLWCQNTPTDIVFQSYRELKGAHDRRYTWDLFLKKITIHGLFSRFEKSSIFVRGLPTNEDLKKPSLSRFLSEVLPKKSISISDPITEEETQAIDVCFHNGWLHADNFADDQGKTYTGYTFASTLHALFMEWKLEESKPPPIQAKNLLELAREVIVEFYPPSLSTERRFGPGSIQRPPEAQYQDEFYRSCHVYSKGSIRTLSEYGGADGRIDFYIKSKKWGVELLRDGNRLEEHSNRFLASGPYASTLALEDYILLDCRQTWPRKKHRRMCIICTPIHPPFCQADYAHRHSETVPRCIQQGLQGGIYSEQRAATCRRWTF